MKQFLIDGVWGDVAYAFRTLARNKGFATVAILTLACGIGANTAVFSVVSAVLLRPLPFDDPDRVVRIVEVIPGVAGAEGPFAQPQREPLLASDLMQLPQLTQSIDYADGYGTSVETRFDDDGYVEVRGARVSGATLSMLGAQPSVGRLYTNDESEQAAPTVILSDRLWRTQFGGDRDVLGRTLTVEGLTQFGVPRQLFTVVGVMAPDFAFPTDDTEFWIPFDLGALAAAGGRAPNVARLADGVSVAAARQEVAAALNTLHGRTTGGSTFEVIALQDELVAPIRPTLRLLSLAVGLVLIIACANVANLLLARTSVRAREVTIRAALGAGRGRLVSQMLTESAVLSLLGGIVGVAFALGGIAMMRVAFAEFGGRPGLLRAGMFRQVGVDATQTIALPRVEHIGIDLATLLFTAGLCVATTLIFGMVPALRATMRTQMSGLREGAAATASSFRLFGRNAMRSLLVVAQVALAVMLLVGAGLVLHGFVKVLFADKGYDTTNAVAFQVRVPRDHFTPTTNREFAQQLVAQVDQLPGVVGAGYSTSLPGATGAFAVDVRDAPNDVIAGDASAAATYSADLRMISSRFMEAMGTRIVSGGGFNAPPRSADHRRVLINERLARLRFPGRSPIGAEVYLSMGGLADESIRLLPWEIVGVVDDVRQAGPDVEPEPQLFVNLDEWRWEPIDGFVFPHYFVLKTHGEAPAVLGAVRTIAQRIDSNVLLDNVTPLDDLATISIARPRTYAMLLGTFGAIAALLAAIGIYGVMAYIVSQSTREIGLRMALGARKSAVLRLVLGRAAVLVALGLIIGLAAAMGGARVLAAMVFGLTTLDPSTFAGVVVLFSAVALLAAYVPARRATRIDPVVALRSE